MNNESLPNFFIIGAAKSGTTALYEVMSQHPQIYLPFQKEPNFFCNEKVYSKGLDWYSSTLFANSSSYLARGEASTHYLYWGEKASSRIVDIDTQKNIKIIVMFRDPVKRAYSHYWMLVRRKMEKLPFTEALDIEEEMLLKYSTELEATGSQRYGYFRGGQYASLLQPFLKRFPRSNFHFILLEDIKNDFSGTMIKLSEFLGIKSDYSFKPVASNQAYKSKSRTLNHFLHYPSGPIYHVLRGILKNTSHSFKYKLRRKFVMLNRQSAPNPPMEVSVEHSLRKRFLIEIEQLEKIIGRDLDHWKAKYD